MCANECVQYGIFWGGKIWGTDPLLFPFPGILLGAPCPEALPLPSLIAGAATLDYHELEEMPEKLRGILSLGTARLALPADSLTLLQMG